MKQLLIDSINLPWKRKLRANVTQFGRSLPTIEGTVHLFTPTLFFKDAVTRNVLEEASVLSLLVPNVKVYAENAIGELSSFTHTPRSLFDSINPQTDRLIYHYSIGTPSLREVAELSVRKHVIYFGITPPEMLRNVAPETAALCQKGIDELPLLASFDSWVANSQFTLDELTSACDTQRSSLLLPPFLSLDKWDGITAEPSEKIRESARHWKDQKILLYLGRRAPNKNVEELIRILAEMNKLGAYQLVVAGGGAIPDYHQLLEQKILELNVQGRVHFFDEPSDEALKFLFERSDALLSASLHEGFCVPLVEAMKMKIPCFISNKTAMPQTLGQTEQFIEIGSPFSSAKLIHDILTHKPRLIAYRDRQHQHYLNQFTDKKITEGYFNFFERVLSND